MASPPSRTTNPFEDAAFALVQAMSPGKRLSKDQIPFDSLKELIAGLVQQKRAESQRVNESSQNGSSALSVAGGGGGVTPDNMSPCSSQSSRPAPPLLPPTPTNTITHPVTFCVGGDDDSRVSCGGDSWRSCGDEGDSRATVSDTRRETRGAAGAVHRHSSLSQLTASASAGSLANAKLRANKQLKRLADLRESRRKAATTDERVLFECSEPELPQVVRAWVMKMLEESGEDEGPNSVVGIYHRIINSLTDFYTKNTWTNNVDKMVGEHLKKFVARSVDEMNEYYEQQHRHNTTGVQRVRETRLGVFVELHCVLVGEGDKGDRALRHTDIVNKLRFLYIAVDAAAMRAFLETELTDNFAQLLPRTVTAVYEELGVPVPIDLEEWQSDEAKMDDCLLDVVEKRWIGHQASSLEKMLEEAATLSGESQGEKTVLAAGELEEECESVRGGDEAGSVGSSLATAPSSQAHGSRRPRVVPETPDEKLRRVREKEKEQKTGEKKAGRGGGEQVQQTPMAKMRNAKTKSKGRLSVLIAQSEARAAALQKEARKEEEEERRRPPKRACVGVTPDKNVLMSPVPSVNRAMFMSKNTPSPSPARLTRAKSNLASKFGQASASTATVTIPEKRRKVEKEKGRKEEGRREEKEEGGEGFGLTVEVLARYRSRMHDMGRRRDGDASEVFYGRVSRRTNLLEEHKMEKEKEGVVQKSRTGRQVGSSQPIYIAHSLLNTHNPNPLSPTKPSTKANATFKMHRMVRPAGKADRIRLQKLKVRFQKTTPPKEEKEKEQEAMEE